MLSSEKGEALMPSKLTASLTVRVSPEVDRLRRELEQLMGLPANGLVEVALRRLKADLDRCRGPEQAHPDEALRSNRRSQIWAKTPARSKRLT
jgi:hypothetical protein